MEILFKIHLKHRHILKFASPPQKKYTTGKVSFAHTHTHTRYLLAWNKMAYLNACSGVLIIIFLMIVIIELH